MQEPLVPEEEGSGTKLRDGELVGLHGSINGRSCVAHPCCGKTLKEDDLGRFKAVVVETKPGVHEEAVAAVRIKEGLESCVVGFLPRATAKRCREQINNKFAQIHEIYSISDCPYKRRKSYRVKGAASFVCLENVPIFE